MNDRPEKIAKCTEPYLNLIERRGGFPLLLTCEKLTQEIDDVGTDLDSTGSDCDDSGWLHRPDSGDGPVGPIFDAPDVCWEPDERNGKP